MTLRHFQIFSEVCRSGSITAAAESLGMAQPAVSNAVKELEVFYSVKLFERMNRRIYITEAGETLLSYANAILSQYDESINILRHPAAGRRLALGMNISVAEKKFYDFIVSFRRTHPEAKLSITVENTTKIEELIMKNELDLAIVDHILDAGSTVALPVSSEHMAAVCSPKYKTFPGNSLSAAELASEELLLRERGSGARAAIDAIFYQRQLTPNRIMESVSTLALAKAAESGLGITILPRDIVREQLEAGNLVELSTPYISFTRNYYLTYRRQKYLTGIMRQFCDEIRTKIPVSDKQNDSAGV